MSYETRLEALRKAQAEGRVVDIGKAEAQASRQALDYAGVDLGDHAVNVFVGEQEGAIRIGDEVVVWVPVKTARQVVRLLGQAATA